MMPNIELDCRGLVCPIPIVRISRTMKELHVGDQLTVFASDPSFQADVQAWTRTMGHQLLAIQATEEFQTAVILKCV